MPIYLRFTGFAALFVSLAAAIPLQAATPTVAEALKLKPVQKDVDYDQPAAEEAAKCTIKAAKTGGHTGWLIRNAEGQVLRNFVDTNNDNVVDLWCYYKDGVEVYRDIDSNFNKKQDQYRWLNTAGTRWGLDKNEDRVIDEWKIISPEEVSAEVVAAIRDRDASRFERLLISGTELSALGFGPTRQEELQKRLAGASKAFAEYLKSQKVVAPTSNWVYFGGGRPSTVPAGTDESSADVTVYDNVAAMVQTDDKHGQVPIGTLVRVGETWRLVDAPGEPSAGVAGPKPDRTGDVAGRPSEKMQRLMDEYAKLEAQASTAENNKRKADILEEIGAEAPAEEKPQWIRQMADVVSAAAQSGGYPDGVKRLADLLATVNAGEDKELAAYVQFRHMTAAYNMELSKPDVEFQKVQAQWLEDLEKYIAAYPKSPDSAEALLQLAIAQEFAGDDANALKWYKRVVENFPKTSAANKSEGAVRRIESIGTPIALKGKSLGGKIVDLAQLKGKVVLIHYWSSDIDACKVDLAALEKLLKKYEGQLAIVGVSLDLNRKNLEDYVQAEALPWPQIWEEGGLNNRLANEMGILTLPTMILVDESGKVINRNAHLSSIEEDLKATKIKPRVANRPKN